MTALLAISGLGIRYGATAAVADLDLAVAAGGITGLVGESGSGKSSVALALLGLLPPAARLTGRMGFAGTDLAGLPAAAHRVLLGTGIGYVPQEPMTALNPCLTVGDQLDRVLAHHRLGDRATRRRQAAAMLERMALPDPGRILAAYPFQLSGGQVQRVLLAQAFALAPRLLIADEPTTALDVTVQAEVLTLIREAAAAAGTAVLFISHNIAVVWQLADSVAVMRHGRLVEAGTTAAVLGNPAQAYTRQLLAALPGRSAPRTPLPVPA